MKLLTQEIIKSLPPIGSTDGKDPSDVPIIVKFFTRGLIGHGGQLKARLKKTISCSSAWWRGTTRKWDISYCPSWNR